MNFVKPQRDKIACLLLMLQDLKLDDEVRLDKIKFSDDSAGEFPVMHPVEQAVVLGML